MAPHVASRIARLDPIPRKATWMASASGQRGERERERDPPSANAGEIARVRCRRLFPVNDGSTFRQETRERLFTRRDRAAIKPKGLQRSRQRSLVEEASTLLEVI